MKREERLVALDDLPEFAAEFAARLKSGDRISLTGDLGSGKTTFLFYVTRALNLAADAGFSSPTFAILNRYETSRFVIHHADLYRLSSYGEFETLDLLPALSDPDAVTFVEWGDKFPELGDFFNVRMRFNPVDGIADSRRISWELR